MRTSCTVLQSHKVLCSTGDIWRQWAWVGCWKGCYLWLRVLRAASPDWVLVIFTDTGVKWIGHTFLSSFVRFLALAMISPSLTKTHPTGTSPTANASSACKHFGGLWFSSYRKLITHHSHSFLHPLQIQWNWCRHNVVVLFIAECGCATFRLHHDDGKSTTEYSWYFHNA
jgi:hypothetical protein